MSGERNPTEMTERLEQLHLKDVPTLRILMLGDKGVGKTSVTSLMATTDITPTTASRSVGACHWSIQVRLHEYPLCAQHGSDFLYFVEFLDVDSKYHLPRAQRVHVFKNIDGIVLVYNLLEPRTQDSLHDWLYEPLRGLCRYRHGRHRSTLRVRHVPILVVGTRLDQWSGPVWPLCGPSSIAQQLNAEEILVNSQDPKSFAPDNRNQEKLRSFLNSAVDFRVRFPLAAPSRARF